MDNVKYDFEKGESAYTTPYVLITAKDKRKKLGRIRVYTKVGKEDYAVKFGVENKKPIYLSCLFVEEKYRNQGVARGLIQTVKTKFKNRAIFLHARIDCESFGLFSTEEFTIIELRGEWALMRLIN